MINWQLFESQLTQFLKSHNAQNEKDTAEFIANKYDSHVKIGKEQYGNSIATSNKEILEKVIYLALLDAKRGKPLDKVAEKISGGVVLYWRMATMQTIIPPPGAISVVTNIITFPGMPIKFFIGNTKDPSILSKALINSFKLHAKTIQGINTALVPAPPGPPVPTPFPWVGIS